MPRRRNLQPRCLGPRWNKQKEQWQITILNPAASDPKRRRASRFFDVEEEANRIAGDYQKKFKRYEGTTIGKALEEYELHMVAMGNQAESAKETVRRLALFFADDDLLVTRITEEAGAELYSKFSESGYWVGPARHRRWKPYTPGFHRHTLAQAKTFMRWCAKPRGVQPAFIAASPLEQLDGVGVVSGGKEQLTGDEARTFYEWCAYKAYRGDDAALALVSCLLMALRQGDVRLRVVRDVDLGCTQLRTGLGSSRRTKSKKGDRSRVIPDVLQPLYRRQIEGRPPFAPLFPAEDGGFHGESWLRAAAHRLCAQAGVPYVCPHGLKGTAGSVASDSGALANQVAEFLSHESSTTSERHYVARGATENAVAGRALSLITGGRPATSGGAAATRDDDQQIDALLAEEIEAESGLELDVTELQAALELIAGGKR